jgi:hypothetical protein
MNNPNNGHHPGSHLPDIIQYTLNSNHPHTHPVILTAIIPAVIRHMVVYREQQKWVISGVRERELANFLRKNMS